MRSRSRCSAAPGSIRAGERACWFSSIGRRACRAAKATPLSRACCSSCNRHGVPTRSCSNSQAGMACRRRGLADSAADLDPGTTNLEGAIDGALSVHARTHARRHRRRVRRHGERGRRATRARCRARRAPAGALGCRRARAARYAHRGSARARPRAGGPADSRERATCRPARSAAARARASGRARRRTAAGDRRGGLDRSRKPHVRRETQWRARRRCRGRGRIDRANARCARERSRARRRSSRADPLCAGFGRASFAQLARRRLAARRRPVRAPRCVRRRARRLSGRHSRRCCRGRCEPSLLACALLGCPRPRRGIDGARRRALVRPRRISGLGSRVAAAGGVGARRTGPTGERGVRRRQVGQHGRGKRRRGSVSACAARGARNRARAHRAGFPEPRRVRRRGARADAARSCARGNADARQGLAGHTLRRNAARAGAHDGDRRTRAIERIATHPRAGHRRLRGRRSAGGVARAARACARRDDCAGGGTRRRRECTRAAGRRQRRGCARRRGSGASARNALGDGASSCPHRARNDRRDAVGPPAVRAGPFRRLAGDRRVRRRALAAQCVGARADGARRPCGRCPVVRARPSGRGDLRARALEPAMGGVARGGPSSSADSPIGSAARRQTECSRSRCPIGPPDCKSMPTFARPTAGLAQTASRWQ